MAVGTKLSNATIDMPAMHFSQVAAPACRFGVARHKQKCGLARGESETAESQEANLLQGRKQQQVQGRENTTLSGGR